ncbi:MAG: caspase family protein [Gemmatimonadales bacterium]|jgi:hypothetical protein
MARVTRFECESMGGTFVVYDPADPNAVIERWLPFAERGDSEAQYRLGLLYEGVMGVKPDYAKAAYWYGQAAKSGHRESMYALSVLYEQGLGVDQDVLKALNLYRQASGIEADSLMLSSQAYRKIETLKQSLAGEISTLKTQRDALAQQVESMSKQSQQKAEAIQALRQQLETKVAQKEQQLAALPSYRLLKRTTGRQVSEFDFPPLPPQILRSRTVGRYYAIVIGNNHYEHLPDLQTAHNDARQIAQILSDHFGFSTQLLLDANEEEIKRAIDNLNEVAGEDDNVLIYFAGHGELRNAPDRSRLRGYWLPTNADEDQDVNWVDNWWITDHLEAAPARRALVIADSCYGGVFSTDLPIGPVTGLPPLGERDLARKLDRRSRFVLASGGESPVIDATGPEASHSVFAAALIEVLQNATGPMSVIELYGRVFDRMYDRLASLGLHQEPELRVIRGAGHESEGDFFFVSQ